MKHHQEIDESEAEYKALFYHAPIPYIVIDKEFYLVKYNLQADATFGFSQTNSEQQSLLEYLSAESVSALKHWIDTQKYLEESLVVDMLHSRDKIVKFQIQLAQNSYSNNHLMLTLTNIQKEYDQLERSRRQKESISSYARHQERLLSLFDKGDAVLFRWRNDEQWSIDYASKNVEHLIGYRYQEFIDEHTVYVKIIHPDDLKRVKSEVEDAKHKNRDFFEHNPYRIITKSGKERWVLDRTIIQKDKKGNITHYLGYIVDITQEKKLQEEIKKAEIKFHTLFEESLDGIALVDPQTLKFIEFNKALLKIYGYTKEEFRQLSPRDLEVIQNPQEIENRRKKILTKGYNRFTTKHYTKSGDIIEILSHVRVITLNEKKLLYVSFHDITPEIKLQQSIIEAKEEAERANQAKSLFLANMSHEIRTPLHGVIGLTDIVLKSNLDSVQREYLGKVKDSSNALLEIINDILDYSKIEAGKVEITRREFLLNELLQKSADLFGFKSHQKNIAFDFDIDPSIPNQLTGDEFRIAQVLNNLIGNAIKFTTQGSVKLTLRIIEQKRDQIEVEFRVQDSGMGIKQSDQSKLFRSFEQADSSTTKKFGGTGLGLVISKELVELMGGVLWLESQEGVGSTFGFTLLFDYPLAQERFSDQALKQKSILIISKNINDSRYLNRLFTQWGAKVTTISTINDLDRQLKQSFFSHMVIDGEFCDDNSGIDKYINRLKELSCILLIPSYYKEDFSQNVFISNMPFDAIIKKPYTPVWIYNTLTN
ncbi:MAG: PAS domain S-box protein, partial [Campylobacterota bacterium]|nr:PAS domain S-box protein [Campylobacterota bacterium]